MEPIVLIGVGEMGGVFAKAFLRRATPVFPALRDSDLTELATILPRPALALVTVGEADLSTTLAALPATWRDRVGLIQNELLPRDWLAHDITGPTVAVVWFEKKPGHDVNVLVPTIVAGPQARAVVEALRAVGIDAECIDDAGILQALVTKNVYILVSNIAGLRTGGTVGELWRDNNELAMGVAGEVVSIQEWLTGATFDRGELIAGMVTAIDGDPGHQTTGRSAPARLKRALEHADLAGIDVPILRSIGREQGLIA